MSTPPPPNNPPTSPTASYATALAAFEAQQNHMGPTRQRYEDINFQHKQIAARHERLIDKMTAHRSTYQRHKQYVTLLTNALLHSNTVLDSAIATSAVTHVQVLTQATLVYKLQVASTTLVKMMVKNMQLDKASNKEVQREHDFFIKCQNMFRTVNMDIAELDRLHADVIKAGAKIGKDAECGREDGRCIMCKRTEAHAAKKAAVQKAEAERAMAAARDRIRGGAGKAVKGKQMLEAIIEED